MSKMNELMSGYTGDAGSVRGNWETATGLADPVPKGIPPPPYVGYDITDLFVMVEFDRDAIQPLLPPDVEPVDACTGGFVFGSQPSGSGISPFSYASICVAIKGFDSPTGMPGLFFPVRNFVGEQAQVFFNTPHDSEITIGEDGDFRFANVRPAGEADIFRISMRLTKETNRDAWISYFYRPETLFGYRCVLPISVVTKRTVAEPIEATILSDDPTLQRLKPVRLLAAFYDTDKTTTWGKLLPLDGSDKGAKEQGQSLFFHFLSRMSQPVAVVGRERVLTFMNRSAERLKGDVYDLIDGRLVGATRENEKVLAEITRWALDQTGVEISAGRVMRSATLADVIVRSLPLEIRPTADADEPSALAVLVFTDGSRTDQSVSAAALELLGLTPAEARTAALIGVGLAPREAAGELGLSESTVRTVLKRVYSKLQLSRQSELAVLVSRIDSITS